MAVLKGLLLALIMAGGITVYVLRSFHPEQPMHHQLNEAGGVLFIAFVLVWWFFPSDEKDL